MDAEHAASNEKSWWRRRNWWKIGFFFLLFVFEVSREIIVVQSDAKAQPLGSSRLYTHEGYTSISGMWRRTGGGDKMAPATITIECYRSEGQCIMASTQMIDLHVAAPDISRFDATFTEDMITFEDASPDCATTYFRIDLKAKKVNAFRDSKPSQSGAFEELCNQIEKRIEMTLGSSYDEPYVRPGENNFVPVLSAIATVVNW